jgi:AcrR family transcriptional regulator
VLFTMATTHPLLQPLHEGPARLAPGDVAAAQRRRMLAAMVAAVAEKGYAAVSVTDVVSRARVSRATFYEQFTDRQDCFLAAFRACADHLAGAVAEGSDAEPDPRRRLRATLDAYLRSLAAFPEGARVCLVDIHAAGPAGARARREVQRHFAGVLARLHEDLAAAGHPVRPVTDLDLELLVGAVSSAVTSRVALGEAAALPRLAGPLERFVLTQFGLAA